MPSIVSRLTVLVGEGVAGETGCVCIHAAVTSATVPTAAMPIPGAERHPARQGGTRAAATGVCRWSKAPASQSADRSPRGHQVVILQRGKTRWDATVTANQHATSSRPRSGTRDGEGIARAAGTAIATTPPG